MAKRAANQTSKPSAKAPSQKPGPALTEQELARVAGGYIGETEKNLKKP